MEEGLKAFHKITINIADQDEKIWRQTAAKKCLKKEIEKIEELSKRYELQIDTLKKDPLFGKYEEANRMIADNINEHIQIHKLLSLAISSKSFEIEQREKDLKSWDKKYAAAVADLKEAYYMKREWIESTNPTFKKLMEIKAAQKGAEVRLKQLKAETTRRRRNKEQLRIIKEMIFHKTIVNFVSAVQRKNKYVEIGHKLKKLEETKKKMVKEMFETQEAMKKCKVRHTPIPSGIFMNKISKLPQHGFSKKMDTKRITELIKPKPVILEAQKPTKVEASNQPKFEKNKKDPILPPTPRKRPLLPDDRLNIISNKIIALPPLRTILSKQRSKMETSFNKSFDSSFTRSQNSQVNSQTENEKVESTPKLSQDDPTETDKFQKPKDSVKDCKINREPSLPKKTDMVKPSDSLKNLKFTTQSNKFSLPKVPSSLFKTNSQLSQKTSILKSQTDKENLREILDHSNLDNSFRRKEKNVNFASPIQQNIEIDGTSSSKEDFNSSGQLTESSNFNMSGFLNRDMVKNKSHLLDDDSLLNATEQQFCFGAMDDTDLPGISQSEHNMMSKPIFGDGNDHEMSFGFSFGGPSKSTNEMWDLFK